MGAPWAIGPSSILELTPRLQGQEKSCLPEHRNYVYPKKIFGRTDRQSGRPAVFFGICQANVMRNESVTMAGSRGSVGPSASRGKVSVGAVPARLPNARRTDKSFPIVGIGSSAGGLEATTELLKNLSRSPGLAIVVVQHLDPRHESALSAVLARATSMPVSEARNNLRLEPNRVYVIPPNRTLHLAERRLKVSLLHGSGKVHRPIDHFLESLAEEEGGRAIGVILSGSGTDGTRGLFAVKASGGITFAQDETSAQFHAMAASAMAAGCVDFVLPPEQIACELARVAGHPSVAPNATGEEVERGQPAEQNAFAEILAILRQRTGVDFTHYKQATLLRRMRRRMVLHKVESLPVYARRLRAHATESKELFSDILIHMSGFFQDVTLFRAFRRKLFPALLKNKPPEEPIRVWVPGCSTGEESYSIAIALLEYLSNHELHHPVEIFATDIHNSALEKAREGVYLEAIKADISAERLRRFFLKTECGYRVNKAIREMCIFARQNVAVDPPFSNLDLISCRNVLVHLGAALLRKVIPSFHFALKSNGYLVLGASETVGDFSDLFALVDKQIRSYAKKATNFLPATTAGHASPNPHLAPWRHPAPRTPAGLSPIKAKQRDDVAEPGKRRRDRKERESGPAASADLGRLNEELAATREALRSILEEKEATEEELRSASEEIMSSNEELKIINEELETAKEELMSTNEELITLNDDLEARNSELEQVNNDLHNFLGNVSLPIIILGPDLCIRRFTAAAEKRFGLIPADVSRPITDINLQPEVPDLSKLVLEAIDNLTSREVEIKDRTGHHWSARIRPYRTIDNKVEGAILAFVDSELAKVNAELASQNHLLADSIANNARLPVWSTALTAQSANSPPPEKKSQ